MVNKMYKKSQGIACRSGTKPPFQTVMQFPASLIHSWLLLPPPKCERTHPVKPPVPFPLPLLLASPLFLISLAADLRRLREDDGEGGLREDGEPGPEPACHAMWKPLFPSEGLSGG